MFSRLINKRRRLSWQHGVIALIAGAVVFVLSHTGMVRNAEFNTIDSRFKLRGPLTEAGPTVVVGIDQQSYDDMAQTFPWPRRYYAKLLENLTEAGARVVVFDLIFDVPGDDPEDDRAFAAAIEVHGRVVLGVKQEALRGSVRGNRLTYPIPSLRRASAAMGLVDRLEDSDGFTRRYRLSVPGDAAPLYSLGVEAVCLYDDPSGGRRIVDRDKCLEIGSCVIPKSDETTFVIDYRGPAGTIPHYSFSSVIDDASFDLPAGMDVDAFDFQKEVFRDKIVVVGATLPEMQDFVRSPFFEGRGGERMLTSGAEMHANAIDSILSKRFYCYPSRGVKLATLLLLALLVTVATVRFRPLIAHTLVGLLAAAYVAVAFGLFLHLRVIVEFVAPVGAMVVCHSANMVYFFVKERRERQRIKGMFAKYVPEKVVDALIENPDLMSLGGEERELTVLFSDLAGFTRFSEGLTPPQLVALLNEYLSEMTDIVLNHGGIIDKYEGDLIMAEFGAPLPDPHHALKACRAALAMQRRLRELREIWREKGREPLFARIGLNTGRVVLGNMGSRAVHDYTVLGDAVNLASRLEGANKVYGTSIMISKSTYEQVRDEVVARELDRIRVVGKVRPVTVFELIDVRGEPLDPDRGKLLAEYGAGLAAYRRQAWPEAEARFSAALTLDPDDPPSRVFLARARRLGSTPPTEVWDGVYDMTGK